MFCRVTLFLVSAALLLVPVSAYAQETIEYYGLDAVGSVRVVFDVSGNILGRTDYEPFGRSVSASGNAPDRKFAQLFRDAEAGLDYAEARSYQVLTGRFNAPDPLYVGVVEPQRWNRYSYSLSNPLGLVDPSGLNPGLTCMPGVCSGARESVTVVGSVGGADGFPIGSRTSNGFGSSGGTTRKNLTQNRDPDREGTHCTLNCAFAQTVDRQTRAAQASVSTTTDFRLPDDSQTIANHVDPMVQIAQDISNTAGALTKPQFYAEFYLFSAAAGYGAKKYLHVDGPSPGLAYGNGRLFQVRVGPVSVFRVDKHPMHTGANAQWHAHIFPVKGTEGLRFPIWPKW